MCRSRSASKQISRINKHKGDKNISVRSAKSSLPPRISQQKEYSKKHYYVTLHQVNKVSQYQFTQYKGQRVHSSESTAASRENSIVILVVWTRTLITSSSIGSSSSSVERLRISTYLTELESRTKLLCYHSQSGKMILKMICLTLQEYILIV